MRRLSILFLALLSGCASFEYELTQPENVAGRIGKADTTFRRDPLEYKLNTVDSRLVMRIYNTTDEPLTLLGDRSSAVDPKGQSHPLPTLTLAPASYIKLILPPQRPRIEREGPTIGIGIGGGFGEMQRRRWGADDSALPPEPRYFTVYDDGQLYWNWDGETTVRLNLGFERGGSTFEHAFVIDRVKHK